MLSSIIKHKNNEGVKVNHLNKVYFVKFFPNGKPQRLLEMKDGDKNGIYLTFFSNGMISIKSEYKNNKRNGVLIEYGSGGIIKKIEEYWKGHLQGRCVEYENGEITQVLHYLRGMKHGYQLYLKTNPRIVQFDLNREVERWSLNLLQEHFFKEEK